MVLSQARGDVLAPSALAEKPVASANGLSVAIHLTEPVLFVQGFEFPVQQAASTAMLRGWLHLRVLKSTKIKTITLQFRGVSTTSWPDGV